MRRVMVSIVGVIVAGCTPAGAPSVDVPRAPEPPVVPSATDAPNVAVGGIERLQAYGQQHPDEFGGMYIDPPGGQHVVMLFTADLEEHAEAVETIQPGTTLRQVEHSEAELLALLESFDFEALGAQGIEMISAGLDTIGNRVTLEAKSNDPTAELRLEASHGGLLDATIHPMPGEWQNVGEGDGWRLLAAGVSRSDAYTVRAATSQAEYAEMWEAIGLDGEAPAVDHATEVAVSFGHGIGSSCSELRLDDVRIADGVVFSATSDPLAPRACTSDLVGAAVFVVAIAHDAVPDGFTLWLNEDAADRGDPQFSAPVEVDAP